MPASFDAPSGSWLRIRAGRFVGYGLWDATSPLAIRIYSRKGVPDKKWVFERVRDATAMRRRLRSTDTDAFRWIFGEGDGLPGIVVDRYGDYAVLVLDSDALEVLVPWVVDALWDTERLAGIVRRNRDAVNASMRLDVLRGRLPPADFIVSESGLRFRANLFAGQKTGLFLDQRDNRRFIEGVVEGRDVLNLFSYTGGFSVFACRGGATRVTSVDSSSAALAVARENFSLNGIDPDAHVFEVADAFDYLDRARKEGRRFDVVISDPPTFARNKKQLDAGLKAYTRLHAAALCVADVIYAAASCTTQIDLDAFRKTLAAGARKAGITYRVIHEAGHASDHPIAIGHPEGRYLKFVVGMVSELL